MTNIHEQFDYLPRYRLRAYWYCVSMFVSARILQLLKVVAQTGGGFCCELGREESL